MPSADTLVPSRWSSDPSAEYLSAPLRWMPRVDAVVPGSLMGEARRAGAAAPAWHDDLAG
jgi:hypothetical protein